MVRVSVCCVPGCEGADETFRFPLKDSIKQLWLENLGFAKNAYMPVRSTVCKKHFASDCFTNLEMRLRRGSVPTENLGDLGQRVIHSSIFRLLSTPERSKTTSCCILSCSKADKLHFVETSSFNTFLSSILKRNVSKAKHTYICENHSELLLEFPFKWPAKRNDHLRDNPEGFYWRNLFLKCFDYFSNKCDTLERKYKKFETNDIKVSQGKRTANKRGPSKVRRCDCLGIKNNNEKFDFISDVKEVNSAYDEEHLDANGCDFIESMPISSETLLGDSPASSSSIALKNKGVNIDELEVTNYIEIGQDSLHESCDNIEREYIDIVEYDVIEEVDMTNQHEENKAGFLTVQGNDNDFVQFDIHNEIETTSQNTLNTNEFLRIQKALKTENISEETTVLKNNNCTNDAVIEKNDFNIEQFEVTQYIEISTGNDGETRLLKIQECDFDQKGTEQFDCNYKEWRESNEIVVLDIDRLNQLETMNAEDTANETDHFNNCIEELEVDDAEFIAESTVNETEHLYSRRLNHSTV